MEWYIILHVIWVLFYCEYFYNFLKNENEMIDISRIAIHSSIKFMDKLSTYLFLVSFHTYLIINKWGKLTSSNIYYVNSLVEIEYYGALQRYEAFDMREVENILLLWNIM